MRKLLRISTGIALVAAVLAVLPGALLHSVFADDNGGSSGNIQVHSNNNGENAKLKGNLSVAIVQSWTVTVTSVSGNTINASEKDGTALTVDASSAKIIRKFGATMTVADIQVGDSLQINGSLSGTSLTAKLIRDLSQQQRSATFSGTVSAVNGSSFVLQTKQRGNQTVNTSSSTVFTKSAQSASLSDVMVNSNVVVSGVWDSTNNIVTASKVNIVIRTATVDGTVTAVSGTTITMTLKSDSMVTDTVDASNAKLIRRFGAAMQITDIQNGDMLEVNGTVTGNNISAKVVRDISLQAHNGTFAGTISAVSTSSFTLSSKDRGNQTVNTDSNTQFRLGSSSASFSDLAVGQTVTVSGVWDRTNSNVTATRVTIKLLSINITGVLQTASGTTLTIMASNNTTYTVDASNAKIRGKNGKAIDLTSFAIGDSIRVQGRMVSGSTKIMAVQVRDLTVVNAGSTSK